MAVKVAGSSFTGEKLGKNLEFFTVRVLVDDGVVGYMPFGLTGVVATRDQLVEAGELPTNDLAVNPITIKFVTGAFEDLSKANTVYNTNVAYDLAYSQQKNFDILVEAISQVAQPILMGNVTVVTGTADEFINATAGSGNDVAVFRFAIEHRAAFADNPEQTDFKARLVAEVVDAIGDALRANSAGVVALGYGTWDSATATKNFVVDYSGTL